MQSHLRKRKGLKHLSLIDVHDPTPPTTRMYLELSEKFERPRASPGQPVKIWLNAGAFSGGSRYRVCKQMGCGMGGGFPWRNDSCLEKGKLEKRQRYLKKKFRSGHRSVGHSSSLQP